MKIESKDKYLLDFIPNNEHIEWNKPITEKDFDKTFIEKHDMKLVRELLNNGCTIETITKFDLALNLTKDTIHKLVRN